MCISACGDPFRTSTKPICPWSGYAKAATDLPDFRIPSYTERRPGAQAFVHWRSIPPGQQALSGGVRVEWNGAEDALRDHRYVCWTENGCHDGDGNDEHRSVCRKLLPPNAAIISSGHRCRHAPSGRRGTMPATGILDELQEYRDHFNAHFSNPGSCILKLPTPGTRSRLHEIAAAAHPMAETPYSRSGPGSLVISASEHRSKRPLQSDRPATPPWRLDRRASYAAAAA